MSKQSDAKAAQGYQTELTNCGNCVHRTCKIEVRGYYARHNKRAIAAGERPRYTAELHGEEGASKCGLGDFAVKKTATCRMWAAVQAKE